MAGQTRMDAYKIGDLLTGFVENLGPVHDQYDSLAEAWEELLPDALRSHCRVAGLSSGCLKVAADGSSYLFELRACTTDLLRELQRSCPAARVRRIDVVMAR